MPPAPRPKPPMRPRPWPCPLPMPEPKPPRDVAPDEYIELVRKKAHQLYEERGGIDGRDLDDWLEAERIIRRHLGIED